MGAAPLAFTPPPSGWQKSIRTIRGAGGTLVDLRFTPEEIAFRDEVRAFIRDNLPPDIRERMRLGHSPP